MPVQADEAFDKAPECIQKIVDNGPEEEYYCTDGYLEYIDIVYPGKHIRNARDKGDTFTVESINSDLRHYIPILRRRSRSFPRKLETLRAVLELFIQAYNAFGMAKMIFRKNRSPNSRELPFSVLDFLLYALCVHILYDKSLDFLPDVCYTIIDNQIFKLVRRK